MALEVEVIIRDGRIVYPLPLDAALPHYDRFDLFGDLFLRSGLVKDVRKDPKLGEAAFYAVQLWSHSWRETPVGTIPADTDEQAHTVGLGAALRRWRAMAPDAVRGFLPMMRPCGTVIEGRLAHPVMLRSVYPAWERRQKQVQKNARDALNTRRRTVLEGLREATGKPDMKVMSASLDLCIAYIDLNDLTLKAGAVEAYEAVMRGWAPPEEDTKVVPFSSRA